MGRQRFFNATTRTFKKIPSFPLPHYSIKYEFNASTLLETRIWSVSRSACTYVCTHVLAIPNSDFAGKSSAIIPFGEYRTCAIVLFWHFMSCYIVLLLCSWKERNNKNCLCLITRQKKCNVVVLRAFPKCFADCLRLFLFFGLHHYGVASDHLWRREARQEVTKSTLMLLSLFSQQVVSAVAPLRLGSWGLRATPC